jgi:hypothetical protein
MVSFDFDGTLSRKDVQRYAVSLIERGIEVWIVTSRQKTETAHAKGWHWVERQNDDLYEVADGCGIPRERIFFTEFADKIEYLSGKGFAFHIDDSVDELMAILESKDACRPVNVGHFEWEATCEEALRSASLG